MLGEINGSDNREINGQKERETIGEKIEIERTKNGETVGGEKVYDVITCGKKRHSLVYHIN